MKFNIYHTYINIPPIRSYRFGFNGKEKLDEQYGEGNAYDFGARIYDPRIGRFLSIDPYFGSYPNLTPYQFAGNTPIQAKDYDGKYIYYVVRTFDKEKGYAVNKVVRIENIEDGIKNIPGWETMMKTKSGQKTINKYLNNKNVDVYIAECNNWDNSEGYAGGGGHTGSTLNPAGAPEANIIDENSSFNFENLQKELQSQNEGGAYFANRYKIFSGITIRKEAKKNYFVTLSPYNKGDQYMQSERLYHEMQHVELFDQGVDPEAHHDEMGAETTDYENDAAEGSKIQQHREELRELKEK